MKLSKRLLTALVRINDDPHNTWLTPYWCCTRNEIFELRQITAIYESGKSREKWLYRTFSYNQAMEMHDYLTQKIKISYSPESLCKFTNPDSEEMWRARKLKAREENEHE